MIVRWELLATVVVRCARAQHLTEDGPERGHGDRVAISLDDPREGPFIVVTQGGAFVTTLGRGMSPTGLPVVSRGIWAQLATTRRNTT